MRLKRQARVALVLLSVVSTVTRAQLSTSPNPAPGTQARAYWIDPYTSLMWAGKDSEKDVSWRGAVKFCRNLRLAGYSDWRLADMFELQGIFDKTANAPGLAGRRDDVKTMWHVRGDLFLTGYQWSGNDRPDDRGKHSGYAHYFDFNDGKSNDQPSGWLYSSSFMRALCVRGNGDPLGWQRKRLQSDWSR